jgi:hypothetical protein
MPPRKRAAKPADKEDTPIADMVSEDLDTPIAAEVARDLKNAKEEDLTHFEEDDNPLQYAGEFVDEDGDGVDDRKESE